MRLGCVEYSNAAPLVWGLSDAAPDVELIFDVPRRLAEMLSLGEIDAGLVPAVEHFRNPEWKVVPGISISCRGRAESVRLFCGVPLDSVETVGVDTASMTSRLLLRVVLEDKYGLRPQYFPLPEPLEEEPPDCGKCFANRDEPSGSNSAGVSEKAFTSMDRRARVSSQATIDSLRLFRMFDAFLLIGDRCMRFNGPHHSSIDLGEEWFSMTGLPFVFAVWMARPELSLTTLEPLLRRSKEEGLSHLDEIASAEARRLGLHEARCLSYLRDTMRYELGTEEIKGLEEFRRRLQRLEKYAC